MADPQALEKEQAASHKPNPTLRENALKSA
jgi:hypothetical protein